MRDTPQREPSIRVKGMPKPLDLEGVIVSFANRSKTLAVNRLGAERQV
jgi:hypothetical protein